MEIISLRRPRFDVSICSTRRKKPTNPRLDVDGNGTVAVSDVILVSQHLDDTAPSTEEPAPVVETQPLEITFENALDLQPGVYQFTPNSYSVTGNDVIGDLWWGSVDGWGDPVKGYPAKAPKLLVVIELDPKPFSETVDGKLAIEYDPPDELLVQIGEKLRQGTEKGGSRDKEYDWTYVVYAGKALENRTHPGRLFEYE